MSAPNHAETSPLAFVNDALAELGEDPLTDLIPESGATNAAAATTYDRCIDTLLSEFEWAFATRDLDLSAIILVDAPPSPWTVQYNLPPNTLRVVSTDQPGEAYAIASNHDVADESGTRRLYAMRTGVRARVVVRPLDELFPAHFVKVVIAYLTWRLCTPVTGDKLHARELKSDYLAALSSAKLHDLSEYPSRVMPSLPDPRGYEAGSDWFGGRVFS